MQEQKLLNLIYHNDRYFVYRPENERENSDNIIDNHLWLIIRHLPKNQAKINLGDIVRFGRIPFKVTKLVLDVESELRNETRMKEEVSRVMSRSMIEIDEELIEEEVKEEELNGQR